jgi:hypothetical protein
MVINSVGWGMFISYILVEYSNLFIFNLELGKNMSIQMFFKQRYKVGHITTYMFSGIPTKYEHELTTNSYQFVRDMHTSVEYSH